MIAYLVFGSFEYSGDSFYGAWASLEDAEKKIEYLAADPGGWDHDYTLVTCDLITGATIGRKSFASNRRDDD